MQGLIKKIKPKFQSNLHSQGRWLLFPQGWQTGTLDADNPIYTAIAGTDADPAVPGFDPGQSADTLYVTNGETTDFADTNGDTVAITPELGEGVPGAGFVFPDDEALVQAEFENILPFHLGMARSAGDPENPVSPSGIEVKPFYLDQDEIDPQNGQQSLFDFKFSVSYGDPQDVRVLAKRSLKNVQAALPDQRRQDREEGHERVEGRRQVRPRQRDLLPRRRGHRSRHQAGRQRQGVVRGRTVRRAAATSPTRSRPTATVTCWSSRPRTTRALRPRSAGPRRST